MKTTKNYCYRLQEMEPEEPKVESVESTPEPTTPEEKNEVVEENEETPGMIHIHKQLFHRRRRKASRGKEGKCSQKEEGKERESNHRLS